MRLDGKRFFITYPQADLSTERLETFFRSIASVDWIRIALETHEDGSPHRHVALQFTNRFKSTNARIFDCDGKHPNIQAIKKLQECLKYCAKEQFVDIGPVPVEQQQRNWDEIVAAAAGNELEWLRVCHEERIQPHVAARLRAMQDSAIYDLDEYDNRPIDPLLEILLEPEYKSMCVVGKPGIGKTGWAMKNAPRPALLVKHLDCLRHFRIGYHKSIVFDDCDFKHLPRSTQLQICDFENQGQIHVRYGVAIIPARTPRLFLCNDGHEPFIYDNAIQERRVQVLHF